MYVGNALSEMVVMGRIVAPYGVQGWVKIQPFTETLDSLFDYEHWWINDAGVRARSKRLASTAKFWWQSFPVVMAAMRRLP
jgi:ribosomal 30S subunit maturation factor RimM